MINNIDKKRKKIVILVNNINETKVRKDEKKQLLNQNIKYALNAKKNIKIEIKDYNIRP